MLVFEIILTLISSFILLHLISNPKSSINRKLPNIKFKGIQLLPTVKVHIRGKIFHLHHWMHLSVVLVISIVFGGFILDSSLTKAFLIGGILQGFSFSDWKKVILKS